jgi:hypothetical protein
VLSFIPRFFRYWTNFFARYIERLTDSTDRTAAIHDAAYIVGVIMFSVWLSRGIYKGKGFTSEWNQAATTFAILVGASQVNGKWADRASAAAQPKEETKP